MLELPAKEINIGKIAKLGDLRNRVASKAQKIAGMVDFELNDILLGRGSVFFPKEAFEIALTDAASLAKLRNPKLVGQKTSSDHLDGGRDLLGVLARHVALLLQLSKDAINLFAIMSLLI